MDLKPEKIRWVLINFFVLVGSVAFHEFGHASAHLLVSTATGRTPLAHRRTIPAAPLNGAPRPIVTHHTAAGLAGRPIPPLDRPTQPQTRLPGVVSAAMIEAISGLH
jgi:hypothetical protein